MTAATWIARTFVAGCAALLAVVPWAADEARAQPLAGPLRIVVGYPPGGASDRSARIVADALAKSLGTTVVVENRTGAGGRLAAQQVRQAPADQNVLMLGNPAVMVVAPLVVKDPGYDPQADFRPVAHVNNYEFVLAVGPQAPVETLPALIAWLKAHPAEANVGVPATGSLPHFFALMVGDAAGIAPQVVGYRGSAAVLTDLAGGRLPVAIDTYDAYEAQHRAGKVRILATSGAARSAFDPALPTFREAGLDVVATGWGVFFAPATMPAERAQRLGDAIRDAMRDPGVQARFREARLEPVIADTAATAAMLKAYRAQWEPVVRRSGYQE